VAITGNSLRNFPSDLRPTAHQTICLYLYLNYAEKIASTRAHILYSIVNYFFGLSGSIVFLVNMSQRALLLGRETYVAKKCVAYLLSTAFFVPT
jgi:hypothetical protein